MDAVSYSHSAKQAKRIKKFINEPDSSSGVVTVPKVIASGETITIPAGRMAVLPNIQVDGTLNVQGDVFIPSGATMSKVVEKVTSTDNAVVRFNGVTGDVQNSGVIIDDNGRLLVGNTPSVLNALGQLIVNQPSSGDVNLALTNKTNDAYSYIYNDGTALKISNSYDLTAGYKPIILQTGGSAMTLDTSGNLLVGTSNGGVQNANSFQYLVSNGQSYVTHITGTTGGTAYAVFGYGGTQIGSITQNGTTAVSYNTTSDYRLKENIRPADCKRFMDIKFVDYERIDGRHECGVIAHELQEIYPDLVTGEKDATEIKKIELTSKIDEVRDEDGNIITEAVEAVYEEQEFPVYQQVNYMGLIARIGTVVQQQAKLIEELRLEVEILKGAK